MSTETISREDLDDLRRIATFYRRKDDYERLFAALRRAGIQPRQTVDEAWNRGLERERRRFYMPNPRSIRMHRLAERLDRAIAYRGGVTSIKTRWGEEHLSLREYEGSTLLLHASAGERRLTYLSGRDEGGRWVVRVPGRIRTIAKAFAWLEPPAVTRARREGRQVLRQGDIYVVESRTGRDSGITRLPDSHRWDPQSRTLTHDAHGVLHVPFPGAFIRQRLMQFRLGSERRSID